MKGRGRGQKARGPGQLLTWGAAPHVGGSRQARRRRRPGRSTPGAREVRATARTCSGPTAPCSIYSRVSMRKPRSREAGVARGAHRAWQTRAPLHPSGPTSRAPVASVEPERAGGGGWSYTCGIGPQGRAGAGGAGDPQIDTQTPAGQPWGSIPTSSTAQDRGPPKCPWANSPMTAGPRLLSLPSLTSGAKDWWWLWSEGVASCSLAPAGL